MMVQGIFALVWAGSVLAAVGRAPVVEPPVLGGGASGASAAGAAYQTPAPGLSMPQGLSPGAPALPGSAHPNLSGGASGVPTPSLSLPQTLSPGNPGLPASALPSVDPGLSAPAPDIQKANAALSDGVADGPLQGKEFRQARPGLDSLKGAAGDEGGQKSGSRDASPADSARLDGMFDGVEPRGPSEEFWSAHVSARRARSGPGVFSGPFPEEIVSRVKSRLAALPTARARVADVGAFDAALLRRLERDPDSSARIAELTAVDIAKPPGIEEALKGSRIRFTLQRAQELDLGEAKTDLLLSTFMLSYLDAEDWKGALDRMRGALSPGGKAVLILHHPESAYMRNLFWSEPPAAESAADAKARGFLSELKRVLERGDAEAAAAAAVAGARLSGDIDDLLLRARPKLRPGPGFTSARLDILDRVNELLEAYSRDEMMRRLHANLMRHPDAASLRGDLAAMGHPAEVEVLSSGTGPIGFAVEFSR